MKSIFIKQLYLSNYFMIEIAATMIDMIVIVTDMVIFATDLVIIQSVIIMFNINISVINLVIIIVLYVFKCHSMSKTPIMETFTDTGQTIDRKANNAIQISINNIIIHKCIYITIYYRNI